MRELNTSFLPMAQALVFDYAAPAADGDVVCSADSSIDSGVLVRGIQITINRTETNGGGTAASDGYEVQFRYAPSGTWKNVGGFCANFFNTNYTSLTIANINGINSAMGEDTLILAPAVHVRVPDGTTAVSEVTDLATSWAQGVVVYGARIVWNQTAGNFTTGIHTITASLVLL